MWTNDPQRMIVDWYFPGGDGNRVFEDLKIAHTVRLLLRSLDHHHSVLHGYAIFDGADVYFVANDLDSEIWQVTNFYGGGIEDFLTWFEDMWFSDIQLEDIPDL
jgi:hypothetical protein